MTHSAHNPKDIPTLFLEAWRQRDGRALSNLFVEDADFINVTGIWWNNREDIFKAHDFGLKIIFKDSEIELLKTKVRYLNEENAIVHAKIELKNQTTLDGQTAPYKRNTLFVFVVQKQEDSWICLSAQNSEILRGVETFIRKKDGSYEAVSYSSPK